SNVPDRKTVRFGFPCAVAVPQPAGEAARKGTPCRAVNPGSTYVMKRPKLVLEPSWEATGLKASRPAPGRSTPAGAENVGDVTSAPGSVGAGLLSLVPGG